MRTRVLVLRTLISATAIPSTCAAMSLTRFGFVALFSQVSIVVLSLRCDTDSLFGLRVRSTRSCRVAVGPWVAADPASRRAGAFRRGVRLGRGGTGVASEQQRASDH